MEDHQTPFKTTPLKSEVESLVRSRRVERGGLNNGDGFLESSFMKKNISSGVKFLLFFIAFAWILHTFTKNFVIDPQFKKFLTEKSLPVSGEVWFFALRAHIILAIIALLVGPLGFIERVRQRNLKWHRYAGRIYVISILLNFLPCVYLACFATGGAASAVGFFVLNLIWVGTTYKAYRAARNRHIKAHRRWMIRSFAVTLANLQLYVLKTVFNRVAGLDYETAYTIAVWLCWLFGLFVAEIIIQLFFSSQVETGTRQKSASQTASADVSGNS